jgi:hypothetical protein
MIYSSLSKGYWFCAQLVCRQILLASIVSLLDQDFMFQIWSDLSFQISAFLLLLSKQKEEDEDSCKRSSSFRAANPSYSSTKVADVVSVCRCVSTFKISTGEFLKLSCVHVCKAELLSWVSLLTLHSTFAFVL